MLKNLKNPRNINVFTIFAEFPAVAKVAGVAVKYASGPETTIFLPEVGALPGQQFRITGR